MILRFLGDSKQKLERLVQEFGRVCRRKKLLFVKHTNSIKMFVYMWMVRTFKIQAVRSVHSLPFKGKQTPHWVLFGRTSLNLRHIITYSHMLVSNT